MGTVVVRDPISGEMFRSVAQTSLRLPPLRSSHTGIDENNLVGRKPRGDPNWRESSCR